MCGTRPPARTTEDGTFTKVVVTSEFSPGPRDSLDQITTLRQSVHAVPGVDAQVGGAVATYLNACYGNERGLLVMAGSRPRCTNVRGAAGGPATRSR